MLFPVCLELQVAAHSRSAHRWKLVPAESMADGIDCGGLAASLEADVQLTLTEWRIWPIGLNSPS